MLIDGSLASCLCEYKMTNTAVRSTTKTCFLPRGSCGHVRDGGCEEQSMLQLESGSGGGHTVATCKQACSEKEGCKYAIVGKAGSAQEGACHLYRTRADEKCMSKPSDTYLYEMHSMKSCSEDIYNGECYNDTHDTSYKYEIQLADITPAACMHACKAMKFSRVRVSPDKCFCWNNAPSMLTKLSPAECNSTCKGDSSKKCGGSGGAMNVYTTVTMPYATNPARVTCKKTRKGGCNEHVSLKISPPIRDEASVGRCEQLCLNTEGCAEFEFTPSQCSLFRWGCTAPVTVDSTKDWYTCTLDPADILIVEEIMRACMLTRRGGCKYSSRMEIGDASEVASITTCERRCLTTTECVDFSIATDTSSGALTCTLFREGCDVDADATADWYSCTKQEPPEGQCYQNIASAPLLPDEQSLIEKLTPTACQETCQSLNYAYAGIESGSKCFCGNQRPRDDAKVRSTGCNTNCNGDDKQVCGGNDKLQLYSLSKSKSVCSGGSVIIPAAHIACTSTSGTCESISSDGWQTTVSKTFTWLTIKFSVDIRVTSFHIKHGDLDKAIEKSKVEFSNGVLLERIFAKRDGFQIIEADSISRVNSMKIASELNEMRSILQILIYKCVAFCFDGHSSDMVVSGFPSTHNKAVFDLRIRAGRANGVIFSSKGDVDCIILEIKDRFLTFSFRNKDAGLLVIRSTTRLELMQWYDITASHDAGHMLLRTNGDEVTGVYQGNTNHVNGIIYVGQHWEKRNLFLGCISKFEAKINDQLVQDVFTHSSLSITKMAIMHHFSRAAKSFPAGMWTISGDDSDVVIVTKHQVSLQSSGRSAALEKSDEFHAYPDEQGWLLAKGLTSDSSRHYIQATSGGDLQIHIFDSICNLMSPTSNVAYFFCKNITAISSRVPISMDTVQCSSEKFNCANAVDGSVLSYWAVVPDQVMWIEMNFLTRTIVGSIWLLDGSTGRNRKVQVVFSSGESEIFELDDFSGGSEYHKLGLTVPTYQNSVKLTMTDATTDSNGFAEVLVFKQVALPSFSLSSTSIERGSLVHTFSRFPKIYSVSFELNVSSFVGATDHNVLRFTIGDDVTGYGYSTPALMALAVGDGTMSVLSAVKSAEALDKAFSFTTAAITVATSTKFVLQQRCNGTDVFFETFVNGTMVSSVNNIDVREFRDVKLFASDSWSHAQPGVLTDLHVSFTAVLKQSVGCLQNGKTESLAYFGSRHTLKECSSKCELHQGCQIFGLTITEGTCELMRGECTKDTSKLNVYIYEMTLTKAIDVTTAVEVSNGTYWEINDTSLIVHWLTDTATTFNTVTIRHRNLEDVSDVDAVDVYVAWNLGGVIVTNLLGGTTYHVTATFKSPQNTVTTFPRYVFTDLAGGCASAAYEMLLKGDGRRLTFRYNSDVWTSSNAYNPVNLFTELRSGYEAASPLIDDASNAQKICVGMQADDEPPQWIEAFNLEGKSLRLSMQNTTRLNIAPKSYSELIPAISSWTLLATSGQLKKNVRVMGDASFPAVKSGGSMSLSNQIITYARNSITEEKNHWIGFQEATLASTQVWVTFDVKLSIQVPAAGQYGFNCLGMLTQDLLTECKTADVWCSVAARARCGELGGNFSTLVNFVGLTFNNMAIVQTLHMKNFKITRSHMWRRIEEKKCYAQNGAADISANTAKQFTLEQCQRQCELMKACEGLMRSVNDENQSGYCNLRKDIKLEQCETGQTVGSFLLFLKDKKMTWSSKLLKTWGDNQCPLIKASKGMTLTECQSLCEQTHTCTAIEIQPPNSDCKMRACTLPVPAPNAVLTDYVGYHLKEPSSECVKDDDTATCSDVSSNSEGLESHCQANGMRSRFGYLPCKTGSDYVGFGVNRAPYIGTSTQPMMGYFLSRPLVVCPFQEPVTCSKPCGFGVNTNCYIKDSRWMEYFCDKNISCAECFVKECEFDAPEGLAWDYDKKKDDLKLSWNEFDVYSSKLDKPQKFVGYKLSWKLASVNGKVKQSLWQNVTKAKNVTWHQISDVSPGSKYLLELRGIVSDPLVEGEATKMTITIPKEGPLSAPSNISLIAHGIHWLRINWTHIPQSDWQATGGRGYRVFIVGDGVESPSDNFDYPNNELVKNCLHWETLYYVRILAYTDQGNGQSSRSFAIPRSEAPPARSCSKTRTGGCIDNLGEIKSEGVLASEIDCEARCMTTNECAEYSYEVTNGKCRMFRKGCEEKQNDAIDWYTCSKPSPPPPVVQTDSGEDCVFPFEYHQKTYDSCTMKDRHNLWCATTGNFTLDQKSANCTPTASLCANDYSYYVKACVNGNNINKYSGKNVLECKALCNKQTNCLGVGYGVAYRGGGSYVAKDCQLSSSADMRGCDGALHNLDFYKKECTAKSAILSEELPTLVPANYFATELETTCTNPKPNLKCKGWKSISQSECLRKCVLSEVADNCDKIDRCTYAAYEDTKQVCNLVTDTCVKTSQSGTTLHKIIRAELSFSDIGLNSMNISWEHVADLTLETNKIMYTIEGLTTTPLKFGHPKKSHRLNNLKDFTMYNVSLKLSLKDSEKCRPAKIYGNARTLGIPRPPQNVEVQIKNGTSVSISWDQLSVADTKGSTLEAYNVTWEPVISQTDLNAECGCFYHPDQLNDASIGRRRRSTFERSRRHRRSVDPYSIDATMKSTELTRERSQVNITHLYGDKLYMLRLNAITKELAGYAQSLERNFTTPESTPIRSAYDVSCEAEDSTRIRVKWEHSPAAYLMGKRRLYTVYYKKVRLCEVVGCCTDGSPCAHGEGTCTQDDHCRGALICGSNNCPWNKALHCCEDGSVPNIALGKQTSHSSTELDGYAQLAVDGNIGTGAPLEKTCSQTCSKTCTQTQPFWEVDLQEDAIIHNVVVFNRLDCCTSDLSNFNVHLLDMKGVISYSCGQGGNMTGLPRAVVGCHNQVARKIRVDLATVGTLSLCEVQVHGVFVDGDTRNETQVTEKKELEITYLSVFSTYDFWLTSSTGAGEGLPTYSRRCTTMSTVPTAVPSFVNASNLYSPNEIVVQWTHIPEEDWNGLGRGYQITYSQIQSGSSVVDERYRTSHSLNVDNNTASHVIGGLHIDSIYMLSITPFNEEGLYDEDVGSVTGRTCEMGGDVIRINYIILPPYVDASSDQSVSDGRPQGVLIKLVEKAINSCAGHCQKRVAPTFTYRKLDMSPRNLTFETDHSEFLLSRLNRGEYIENGINIKLTTSPGPALLMVKDGDTEKATENESLLLTQLMEAIPTVLLYLLLNCAVGILIWFVYNPWKHTGHCQTIAGMMDNMWMAFMTATTIGYGDLFPRTIIGRTVIMIWTLVGLIVTSIVVGTLTSALSSEQIIKLRTDIPTDKVVVMPRSGEYYFAKRNNIRNISSDIQYNSYDDLLQELYERKVRYALIDSYILKSLSISESYVKVKKVYYYEMDYGIVAYGAFRSRAKCIAKFAEDNEIIVTQELEAYDEMDWKMVKLESNDELQTNGTHKEASQDEAKMEILELFSAKAPMFQKALQYLLYIFAGAVCLGLIADFIRRIVVAKRKMKIHTDHEMKLIGLNKLQCLELDMRDEIDQLCDKVNQIGSELDYKHGKELVALQDDYSKLYGINFKYVKLSDLGIPRDRLAQFREEALKRVKVTRWQKFKNFVRPKWISFRMRLDEWFGDDEDF